MTAPAASGLETASRLATASSQETGSIPETGSGYPGSGPTVSVVIAAFASERWASLRDSVASVRAQTRPPAETIVVIDHNQELLDRARRELQSGAGRDGSPPVMVMPNTRARGASGARNTGVAASQGSVVAFLDDDACATPGWLQGLAGHFDDAGVAGVGGRLDPLWEAPRPAWFPGEFGWVVGMSYDGMPQRLTRVRNVWASNMAVRRAAFQAADGFREDFGKVGAVSRPEDTDLCLRVTSGAWLYDPDSAVGHLVPAARTRFRYFLVRCFNEGRGKADLAALNGAGASMSEERGYASRVLPRAVARELGGAARGDRAGLLRGAAIVAGASAAAAGFAAGTMSALRARTARVAGTRAPGAAAELTR
jgi:GT2 family glycosyltransferase